MKVAELLKFLLHCEQFNSLNFLLYVLMTLPQAFHLMGHQNVLLFNKVQTAKSIVI